MVRPRKYASAADAKVADREMARERMRRLRIEGGGLTPHDRARNEATRRLIEKHRDEFELLEAEALNGVDTAQANMF